MRRGTLAVCAVLLLAFASTNAAQARSSVASLTATPTTLPAAGGHVRIRGRVTRATLCTWSVTPHVAGLPIFGRLFRCRGRFSLTVTVPPSTTAGVESLRFRVSALGSARTVAVREAPNSGPVGATLDVHGAGAVPVAVTITGIVDPALATRGYSQPPTGSRLVAIDETFADIGPHPALNYHPTVSFNPALSTSVVGTDYHSYKPSGVAQGCSTLLGKGFTFYGGESGSACVSFTLPAGVGVAQVRFTLANGFGAGPEGESAEAEWNA